MEDLKTQLKQQIIEALNLEGMTPDQIDSAAPLFGEGLGLDSIDALELIVLLEKNYQIRIEDPKDGRKVFHSIDTMAAYITEHKQAAS
jgi:acyl carrier protein